MNLKKLLLLFSILVVGLSSCNSDEEQDPLFIVGTWQYASIEDFHIETDNDSLTAAIKYAEIESRKDSLIMDFKEDSILCLTDKRDSLDCNYKYTFDKKGNLTLYTSENVKTNYKFDIIGKIALYRTGAPQYRNTDGTVNKEEFARLTEKYPNTLKDINIDELKIGNIYFIEVFKKLDTSVL